MRLSDVTTAKSNVFAVWITVGYFEVKKVNDLADLKGKYPDHNFDHISTDTFNKVYPDGYVLGAEMGLEDGTVQRQRAFYLIDRSEYTGDEFKRGDKVEDVVIQKTLL